MNDSRFSSPRILARALARHRAARLALGASIAFLAACSVSSTREANVGTTTSPLAAEKPDGDAAILVQRKYGVDPRVMLTSYAAPSIDGCSASMIGPNVLMTAAHCGYNNYDGSLPDKVATFKVARGGGWSDSESFLCHKLFTTWGSGSGPYDFMALYCDANERGENPGDKYGYLDFDPSTPTVGQSIYSLWANPLDSTAEQDARLYSLGTVAAVGSASAKATLNLWGEPGASGSPHLNVANSRVIIGPLSQANGLQRFAYAINDYLSSSQILPYSQQQLDGSAPVTVYSANSILLTSLLPQLFANEPNKDKLHELARYRGAVDKNGNKLFDIQEDVEKYRGENARDWYALGFESERQNAVWETQFATMDPAHSQVQIATPSSATESVVLRHRGLHLKPNTTYRVSLQLDVRAASRADGLRVSFRGASAEQDGAEIPTIASGQGFHFQTFTLRTTSEGSPLLEILARGQLTMGLAVVDVIEEGAVMRFDTYDQRLFWKNDIGGRAFIMPEGEDGGDLPSWAGLVRRTPSVAQASDWEMRSAQLALVAGRDYRVCFDVLGQGLASSGTTIPTTGSDWGVLRVVSAGQEIMRRTFSPTASWGTVCSSSFHVPDPNSLIQMGVIGSTSALSYLVDNLRILPAQKTSGASGMHVVHASYGVDFWGAGDNEVSAVASCEGRAACDVTPIALPDPAPGRSKRFTIEWTCDGNPRAHRIDVPKVDGTTGTLNLSCPGIHVTQATYGGNVGVAQGNVTADVAATCAGGRACDYAVDYTILGDPAVGLPKDFVVKYTCDGGAERSVSVPPEAGFGSRAQLTCPTVTPGIKVVSAIYGGNVNGGADVTSALGTACNGKASCPYVVDYQVIGDPAPGLGKTFVAQYTCTPDGIRRTLTLPAEAGLKSTATLHCP